MPRRTVIQGVRIAALLLPMGLALRADATGYQLEVQQRTGENFFARNVYICGACTPEQFATVTVPSGFERSAAKLFLPEATEYAGAPPGPGAVPSLDLLVDIPGDEFRYVAHVSSATVLSIVPGYGVLAAADVERFIRFRFSAGSVVHELTDPDGYSWILFAFGLDGLAGHDLEQLDSLADLPIPTFWTYSSRVLDRDLVLDSEGLARVLSQGGQNNWQRYDPTLVPEPGTCVLVAAGVAGLALRRGRETA